MSPAFPARRRAEQFDALIEGTSTSPSDAAMGDLLELVATLRTAPRIEARPEFVLDLREQLMLAARTELVPARTAREAKSQIVTPARTGRERKMATVLGGFALVGATASMAVAAQHALPGDQLYPMKRAIENAHTNLSIGNDAKGSTLLANAQDRLDEVDALTHDGHGDPVVITQTLNAFTHQASQASNYLMEAYAEDNDKGAVQELAAFTANSNETLKDLVPDVPAEAQDALATATRTISTIQHAAITACPTCAAVVNAIADGAPATVPTPGTSVLTSPIASDIPSLPTDVVPTTHPVPTPSDSPILAPTTPVVVAPTTAPSSEPTDDPSAAQPPSLFPTAPPSSSAPSSGSGSAGQGGGGQSLPSTIASALGQSGTTSNPQGGPVAPIDLPSIVNSAVAGITGLLPGSSTPSSAPSGTATSSSSSSTPHHTKHHHHHHGKKDSKADTSQDSGDQAGDPLDLLGD